MVQVVSLRTASMCSCRRLLSSLCPTPWNPQVFHSTTVYDAHQSRAVVEHSEQAQDKEHDHAGNEVVDRVPHLGTSLCSQMPRYQTSSQLTLKKRVVNGHFSHKERIIHFTNVLIERGSKESSA
jgi:hypothetical protein